MVRLDATLAEFAYAKVVELVKDVEAFVLKKFCTNCSKTFCCPEGTGLMKCFHQVEHCKLRLHEQQWKSHPAHSE